MTTTDRWTMRGTQMANCNCAWGCPCQFNAPTTHGHCEAVEAGHIEEGHFNDTRLDGLNWVMLVQWPGEIADGNGREQMLIDERADADQREALRKILHGESTAPGATHFYVFNSTMSEVLEPLYVPVSVDVDVEAGRGSVRVPGMVDVEGRPIENPNSGEPFRARVALPESFQWTHAEFGTGRGSAEAGIRMAFDGTHAHFAPLHMNQDGVVR